MRANTNRTNALTFGELVGDYDVGRPRLPKSFVAATASRTGLPPQGDALEVGAGTGQLTGALLGAGWCVKALEPSAPMADRLTNRYAAEIATGQLVVIRERFETAVLDSESSFDAVWSADAWHWVDPSVGYSRAARLLRPGGRLIATWTMAGVVHDADLADRLNDVYKVLSADLVRDPRAPVDEATLAAGREEINSSNAMAVSDYWTEEEQRLISRDAYVAWQLSYAHIVEMATQDRQRLARTIADALAEAAQQQPMPIRILRYVVASRRLEDSR
jgi:SAM-dependent methyltransferase